MPYLSTEQIDEIEVEMADLVDENKELRDENVALKAEVLRLRERLKTD
jgi:regulator of replication initiation timing